MTRLRIVMHAHSTWSYDGKWPLSRLARFYGAFGIHAVMMSEHDTGFDPTQWSAYRQACTDASTSRCTLIPGIEYSSPDNDIHLPTWGMPEFLAEHRPVTETLEQVSAEGAASIFAHPIRREAFRQYDPAWTQHLSGIEVWNRKSDGVTWGREAWQLATSTGLSATVGQDFHRLRHAWPLTMTCPRPEGDLEAGLVSALRAGQMRPEAFRSSLVGTNGPKHQPHDWLEARRRSLRDLIRGRRS